MEIQRLLLVVTVRVDICWVCPVTLFHRVLVTVLDSLGIH